MRADARKAGALLLAAWLAAAGCPRSAAAAGGSLSLSLDRSSPEQGEVVRVELRGAPPPDNGSLHWKGRAWPMRGCGEGCLEALAGIDLAEAPGRHTVSVLGSRSGESLRADFEIEVRERAFPVQAFAVPKELDARDPSLLRRIEEEAGELRRRFESPPSAPAWSLPFAAPVPGFAPSHFGDRRVINGEPRIPHSGGDMTLPAGTPVRSVADGKVVFSGEQYFGGNEVVIDHGGGVISMYFHLAERLVAEGQPVKKGDPVGAAGATGRATGPHLHFGLRVTGARVDPASLPGIVERR
jgi:murein DD-endopeptidase MepM/ murein hydrolase activator NlpD